MPDLIEMLLGIINSQRCCSWLVPHKQERPAFQLQQGVVSYDRCWGNWMLVEIKMKTNKSQKPRQMHKRGSWVDYPRLGCRGRKYLKSEFVSELSGQRANGSTETIDMNLCHTWRLPSYGSNVIYRLNSVILAGRKSTWLFGCFKVVVRTGLKGVVGMAGEG